MSAPAAEIPHATGAMTEDQAFERLMAKSAAERAPKARTPEPPVDESIDFAEDDASEIPVEVDPVVEGDEFGAEDEEPQALSSDPLVKFDDGTELPMSEVKRGFLRQQDYTRKTQETAELRKSVEAERSTYLAEKKQAAANLEPLIQAAVAMLQNPREQAELEQLRGIDPGAYAVRMMERQQQAAQVQQLQMQQRALAESAQREEAERYQRERAETAKASRETLVNTIPAFKKDFDAEYRRLGKYVVEEANVPAELWDNEVDHRVITLAWKAMQYDAATRKTPATQKQLRNAPQPMRPGAAKPAGHAQARAIREATERANKSGSIEDFAALRELKNRLAQQARR